MDVPYISMQLNLKNSSSIVVNKIICKIMKIDFENSPKINFWFLETKIWYAWLNVGKKLCKKENTIFICILYINLSKAQAGNS